MPRYPKGMDVHTLPGAYHSGRATKAQLEFTLNKLLKGAGAGADPTEIDVPSETANSILTKLQKHLGVWWFNNNWMPAGMINSAMSGTGTINWYCESIDLNTGTTSGSYAYAIKTAWGLSRAYSWDKKRYFSVYVYLATYAAQNFHIVSGHAPTTGAANVDRHIGFKLINGSIYGTVADGTTEATLLLETPATTVYRRLECTLTPGVECRFYVDGVDKGAITANLPTGTTYAEYLARFSVNNTEAVNKYMDVYESRTFQEE